MMWTWYTQRCIQFGRIIKMSTASSLKNESTVKSSGPDASSKTNPKTPEKNERYNWVWCFTNVTVKLTLINVKFSYWIIYHSLHLLVFVKIHFLCYENMKTMNVSQILFWQSFTFTTKPTHVHFNFYLLFYKPFFCNKYSD